MLRSTLRLVFVSSALALLASCGSDSTSPRTQRTAISLDYCPGDAPVWAAYQDESGPWKHVAISGTTLSFTATGNRLGIAQVFVDGAQTYVAVRYLTPGDLAPVNGVACRPLAGTKQLSFSLAGLAPSGTANSWAEVAMGGSQVITDEEGTYQLTNLTEGALDLVAVRLTYENAGMTRTPDRIIVRRGVNLPTLSTIPVVDFGAAEAFAPAQESLGVTGIAPADDVFASAALLTASGTTVELGNGPLLDGAAPIYGLQPAAAIASDLYIYGASAGGGKAWREATRFGHAFESTTLALGPALSTPTVTLLATGPYLRARVQIPRQPEYGSALLLSLDGAQYGTQTFTVVMSGTYLGSATPWDFTLPDLSGVDGWSNAWALPPSANASWTVLGEGASFNAIASTPRDGDVEESAALWSEPVSAARVVPPASSSWNAAPRRPSPDRRMVLGRGLRALLRRGMP